MQGNDKTRDELILEIAGLQAKYDALLAFVQKSSDVPTDEVHIHRLLDSRHRTLPDDTAPALIWTSGSNAECDYFNAEWLNFTGRSLRQELGNGWKEGVHPDDSLFCEQVYSRAFDRREPFHMEYRLRHNTGSYHWIIDFGIPRFNSDGVFLGFIGHCYDIDARKQQEYSLKFTQFAIDNLHYPVFWMNAEGDFVYVNKAGCESLGYNREELLAMTLQDIDPDYPIEMYKANWKILKQEKKQVLESVHRSRNGKVFPVEVHANYLEINGQEFNCVFTVDISRQKEVQEELKRRNEDLQLMITINNAANQNEELQTIVNLMAAQLKKTFNSHLISVHIPDPDRRRFRMVGNTIDHDLQKKIEKIIGRRIPEISLLMDQDHPFKEIEQTGRGILSIGKKEVVRRLSCYLQGSSWPLAVQKIVGAMLPALCELLKYRSSISVPLISRGETVGYFEIGSRDIMTAHDLSRIQNIADHLASVIVRFEYGRKLRESEERLSSAFSYAAIGMAFVGLDGKWLKVNPAITDMLGYTEEELLLKTFQDITHPDDLDADLRYVKEMVEGLIQTYQMEKRYFHKTGRIVWALLSVSLVHDHNGKPLHFISQIQDITTRKYAEEALRENERKFRTLYETMAQGVVYQDKSGAIIDANPAAERILGLTIGQMQGRTSIDPRWHAIQEDGSPFRGDEHPAMVTLKTGQMTNAIMGVFNPEIEQFRWINVKATPELRAGENDPFLVYTTFDDITDLKNAFDELARANDNLEIAVTDKTRDLLEINAFQKAILDNAPFAILTTDDQGTIRTVNPAGEQITGYSAGELIGKMKPFHFHDKEELQKKLGEISGIELLREDELFRIIMPSILGKVTEWTWVKKNGERFPVKISISSLSGPAGAFYGYMGLILDITKEKENLEALRESEERFFKMFQDHSAIMLLINPETGGIIQANTTACEYYGIDFSRTSKTIDDLLTPGQEEQEELAENNPPQQWNNFTSIHQLVKGTIRMVEVHSTPIEVKGKTLLFSIIHDVTERKIAESALRKSEAENRAIIRAVPDLMFRIHRDGTFLKVLSHNEMLLFRPEAEFIGRKVEDVMPSNLAELSRKASERAFSGSEMEQYEYSLPVGNTDHYFENRIIPISDDEALSIIRDITSRVQAQRELLEAKNEAEKANLAKSEFLSRMSHELRTPMNSILGFAQLLEMSELSPKQKKGVAHILNNGRHLLDLINEVLDIAGIEAGRQTLNSEIILLSGIIREVVENFLVTAGKRQIKIDYDHTIGTMHCVKADRLRLKQVLINLLNNAIKYNNAGGRITIHSEIRETTLQGTNCVRISVTDTGMGIRPEDIGKLFQHFERIGAERTETEGSGLGLMIVKKLTEAMGGSVGVESEPGKGSTFWVELPHSGCQGFAEILLRDQNWDVPEQFCHESNILYIEDNLSNVEFMEAILAQHRPGLRLVSTRLGSQTVSLAKKFLPGLILLDLDLSDMQGISVLEQILADDQIKNIPVIIVSADAMPNQINRLLNAGAKKYLIKPLDITLLLETIDLYIQE